MNVTLNVSGKPPKEAAEAKFTSLYRATVSWALSTESLLVKNTPVGIGGALRQGWSVNHARDGAGFAVEIVNSSSYLLAVEMGRRAGKGISVDGQRSVALWAQRKLGIDAEEAKGFAFLLSRKYKNEGRPAIGFIGLAAKGGAGGREVPEKPIAGSLLHNQFRDLENRLAAAWAT